jgi:uncharacterized protein YbcI
MTDDGQVQEREPSGASDPRSTLLSDVSREMVRMYKEQFGRGPTHVRTSWAGPDTIVTTLEDTLTPAERNLARLGEHERLRETRTFFQYASVAEFCEPVERLTGRKVRAFISGIDSVADGLAVELFVLHPPGSTEPSRAAAKPEDEF